MGKRSVWIAEAIIGAIGVVALVMGYDQIAVTAVVAIAATLDKLTD